MNPGMAAYAIAILAWSLGILAWNVPSPDLAAVVALTIVLVAANFVMSLRRDRDGVRPRSADDCRPG